MKICESISEWKNLRRGFTGQVGLVPTMGFLHEGHLSLVRRARRENAVVVVWIFVNPKQFGENEDFSGYPRDRERDLKLLRGEGVDWVLAPGVEDVYPPGFQTEVGVRELSRPLEGAARPGHFTGVASVVCKMFCLTQPRFAYFGEKDAQQCLVVERMTRDLGFLTDIVVCPTIREPDGLAISSRNIYLNSEERLAAAVLYRALRLAADLAGEGMVDCRDLRERMLAELAGEPLAKVEYVSIAAAETLAELAELQGPAVISLAVGIGQARLIDNIRLPSNG